MQQTLGEQTPLQQQRNAQSDQMWLFLLFDFEPLCPFQPSLTTRGSATTTVQQPLFNITGSEIIYPCRQFNNYGSATTTRGWFLSLFT